MTFLESISTCLNKYATFAGTATRSEYWWFLLFQLLAGIAAGVIGETAHLVFSVAMLVPGVAVTVRRLHDTDRSAWWLLVMLVPVLGWIAFFVFMAQASRSSRFALEPVQVPAEEQGSPFKQWLTRFRSQPQRWGVAVLILVLCILPALSGSLLALKTAEPYTASLRSIQASPDARAVLGEAIEAGWMVKGSLRENNMAGEAVLFYEVAGDKAKGDAQVRAFKLDGVWVMRTLVVNVDGAHTQIDLLQEQFDHSEEEEGDDEDFDKDAPASAVWESTVET